MTPRFRVFLLPALVLAVSTAGCEQQSLELTGSVERTALELAAPVSEVIVDLPVAIGEHVDASGVVVKLDTEVAEAELTAYEAAHASALATRTEAEGEYQRIARLRQAGVATPQALDEARRQRDEAVALVAEKAARIAQARKRLRDLHLTSIVAGVVDQLPYQVGERVPAGGVVAVVLADEKPWVRVWLPSRAVARVSAEATALVRVEGLDQTLHGHVADISREPEFTPHYALTEREGAHLVYETRIVLDDAPPDLRPGLPAQVDLNLPAAVQNTAGSS